MTHPYKPFLDKVIITNSNGTYEMEGDDVIAKFPAGFECARDSNGALVPILTKPLFEVIRCYTRSNLFPHALDQKEGRVKPEDLLLLKKCQREEKEKQLHAEVESIPKAQEKRGPGRPRVEAKESADAN